MYLSGILYYWIMKALEGEKVNVVFENIVKMNNPAVSDYIVIKHLDSNINNFGIGGEMLREVSYFEVRIQSENMISVSRYYQKISDMLKTNTTITVGCSNTIDIDAYDLEPVIFTLAKFVPREDVAINVGDCLNLREGKAHVLEQLDTYTYLLFFGNVAQYYTELVRSADITTPKRGTYEIRLIAKLVAIY